MSESVHSEVRAFIVREFLRGDGRDLEDTTPLLRSGILDSLKIVTLLAFLEEHFHISVSTDDVSVANFSTIARIGDLVRDLAARGATRE